MKRFHMSAWGLASIMGLATSAAQAGITQPPTGPSQVTITHLFGEGVSFAASGSARSDGRSWVADVVEVSPGVFKLAADAGLQVVVNRLEGGTDPFVWRDFSIAFDPVEPVAVPYVTADRYVNGVKFDSDVPFARIGDALSSDQRILPVSGLPEGQSLLWLGNGGELAGLANQGMVSTALWSPVAFASIQVSAVPEPAVWQSLGLGLVGLTGLRAVRRRQRGAAASGVNQA